MASIKTALANSALFNKLTDEELDKVTSLSRQEVYPEGTLLFSEGTMASDLYIVGAGQVAVEMKLAVYAGLVQKATVEIIIEGDTFGWSAVLGSLIYSLSARALEPVRVITIDGDRLHSMLDENPDMGYRVMTGLVEVVSSRLGSIKKTLLV